MSTCSQKVRLVLAEKNIAFTGREMDFLRKEHLEPWYLEINPNGVLPAIVHDDRPVIDSSVICEYLDEIFDGPRLAPPDAYGRARMREWMRYLEEVPTVAIRVPSFNKVIIGATKKIADETFETVTEKMPIRKHFYREMGQVGFSSERVAESIEKLHSSLKRVNTALADGRPFLLGDDFGIADVIFIPTIVRMEDLGLGHLWAELPHTHAWYQRVQARPSFAATYYLGARFRQEDWEARAVQFAAVPTVPSAEAAQPQRASS